MNDAHLMLARRLLVALASDAVTAEPTLHLLRSQYGGMATLVPAVVCAPLPEQVRRIRFWRVSGPYNLLLRQV